MTAMTAVPVTEVVAIPLLIPVPVPGPPLCVGLPPPVDVPGVLLPLAVRAVDDRALTRHWHQHIAAATPPARLPAHRRARLQILIRRRLVLVRDEQPRREAQRRGDGGYGPPSLVTSPTPSGHGTSWRTRERTAGPRLPPDGRSHYALRNPANLGSIKNITQLSTGRRLISQTYADLRRGTRSYAMINAELFPDSGIQKSAPKRPMLRLGGRNYPAFGRSRDPHSPPPLGQLGQDRPCWSPRGSRG